MNAVGEEEKEEWLQGVGRKTYIAQYAKSNVHFRRSSCLLTAAILRYRTTKQLWWNDTNHTLTQSFVDNHPLFQIGFGEDGDYDHHILTVYKGMIYQSVFKKTNWDVRDLVIPDVISQSLNDEDALKLTGFDLGDVEYTIYLPENKI